MNQMMGGGLWGMGLVGLSFFIVLVLIANVLL